MLFSLALRSLASHPIRSAVLVGGFSLGVSVMANLLGIGAVMLEQARAPALAGGGDVVVAGTAGKVTSARFILSSALDAPPLRGRVRSASPTTRARLYLVTGDRVVPIRARGGIPSMERSIRDDETSRVSQWTDAPGDTRWASPDPGDVLRAMDRFHPIPDTADRADSWAEWLYFNGRSGATRFYLTFMIGPRRDSGDRVAGVRLQLDQNGQVTSYADSADVDEQQLLADAPELTIGRSRIWLDGDRYHISLDLPVSDGVATSGPAAAASRLSRVTGEIILEAVTGQSLAPITIKGAGGWESGYVVPVMSGGLSGTLSVGGDAVSLDGGVGYHDHNWGYWEGVSWQWGQVQTDGFSFVYGRLYPPASAADPDRVPGFLTALGPDGPIAFATDVSIEETSQTPGARPDRIVVHGRSASLDLTMTLDIRDAIVTPMDRPGFQRALDFYQLSATYRVTGHAGDQEFDFTSQGAAETFRGR